MIQFFFKTAHIHPQNWEKAYQKIESIALSFPLKLLRIEPYYRSQPKLDKDHFDLREDVGTPDERLSFYGDWVSHTHGTTMCFYKNWEKHIKNGLRDEAIDPDKPITWYPHRPSWNDNPLLKANGATTKHLYLDTRGALYEYAILAIGIMLENVLLNKFFLTANEQNLENIEKIVAWLEAHFNENFDRPFYFDKKRLLASFINGYENKVQAVCRMEHLYQRQYKHNMVFAIENIGYKPSFDCYAGVLSSLPFGTFGFSDVLDAWVAATEDLENTLGLIAASKKLALADTQKKPLKEYDLTHILKRLLNEFVLWTPLQREELAHFFTNKEALETGEESLKGMLLRMSGRRLNICPIYTTPQELFETFMYHEPKKGADFKKIIDAWVVENGDAFDKLKQKLAEVQLNQADSFTDDEDDDDEPYSVETESFISQYPKHEQFFIAEALESNPVYANVEAGFEKLHQTLKELRASAEHREHVKDIKTNSKKENVQYIRHRIKEIDLTVHPHFEEWLKEEQDKNVLFYLTLLMSIKMYNRSHHYIRFRLLWERGRWDIWRKISV